MASKAQLPYSNDTAIVSSHWTSTLTSSALRLLILSATVLTFLLYYTGTGVFPLSASLLSPSTPLTIDEVASHVVNPQKEAYVTFLSAKTSEDYFTSARLLLFSLKHDRGTRDPFDRDFVIIVPPGISSAYTAHLENEGAITLERPLIDTLPVPEGGWKLEWQEVYTKLWIFNLTQYDRVVFYDADHLVLRPVHSVWEVPGSWPESGLASLGSGEGGNVPGSSYFLAGFFLARPSHSLMEELLQVRDYDPVFPEQNLLNKYFDQNGLHPWVELDQIHERISPQDNHIGEGYHTVHEKLWKWGPEGFRKLFLEKKGIMEKYWLTDSAGND